MSGLPQSSLYQPQNDDQRGADSPPALRRPSEESLARGRTDTHHQKDSQEASLIQLRSQLHELDKDDWMFEKPRCTFT
ncbi:hypothetical protein ACKKBG_A01015 [Auxenochlorella protothecoides x Auxenochlorella symbiontica]